MFILRSLLFTDFLFIYLGSIWSDIIQMKILKHFSIVHAMKSPNSLPSFQLIAHPVIWVKLLENTPIRSFLSFSPGRRISSNGLFASCSQRPNLI
ncbi:hypothetical protein F5878DRAFT_620127 [Lentinula raphanica]|uniref:Uncharacterized protein n=1 Tax=Lentinula raphanica TaxID=153919 RepID=A0AA38UDW2_9AGAR|nr:hypothetical protein F5878DRAFT_620127 [Lentinula raphanica]